MIAPLTPREARLRHIAKAVDLFVNAARCLNASRLINQAVTAKLYQIGDHGAAEIQTGTGSSFGFASTTPTRSASSLSVSVSFPNRDFAPRSSTSRRSRKISVARAKARPIDPRMAQSISHAVSSL
jgi:hypothetical protein